MVPLCGSGSRPMTLVDAGRLCAKRNTKRWPDRGRARNLAFGTLDYAFRLCRRPVRKDEATAWHINSDRLPHGNGTAEHALDTDGNGRVHVMAIGAEVRCDSLD